MEHGIEMRQLCCSLNVSDERLYGTYCAVAENTLGVGLDISLDVHAILPPQPCMNKIGLEFHLQHTWSL